MFLASIGSALAVDLVFQTPDKAISIRLFEKGACTDKDLLGVLKQEGRDPSKARKARVVYKGTSYVACYVPHSEPQPHFDIAVKGPEGMELIPIPAEMLRPTSPRTPMKGKN